MLADTMLYTSDFRAAERTFSMLTQVIGRAGRAEDHGVAIVQTSSPNDQTINLAARQDYDAFYEMEVAMRQRLLHPPFGDLAVITFTGKDERKVLHGAAKLRTSLLACLEDSAYKEEICTILGPASCAVPKINYSYRYRLTLKCKFTPSLRQLVAHMLRQFSLDRENRGVTAFADVNGYE